MIFTSIPCAMSSVAAVCRADSERCALIFDGDARLMARELDVTVEVLREYVKLVEAEAV
jgi:hypothetical protein